MKKLCMFLLLTLMLGMFAGCISTSHFQAWSGPQEFEGKGGAFETKDGIDIYSSGTPYKRCQVIGIITTTTISRADMMMVFGNSWAVSSMVKEAKARGGNAVILADDKTQTWIAGGTDANGNSTVTENQARDRVAMIVKYLGDVESQTLTPEIEGKLIGHWIFTVPPERPLTGQIDFYFLPENRYKSASNVTSTNGQPVTPVPNEAGRYYFEGNNLVIWSDNDKKPSAPVAFSVTDTQLTFYEKQGALIFHR
jgi:uncharacterized protein YbjQ (UPF0145 family)